jgi:hypothetical protein
MRIVRNSETDHVRKVFAAVQFIISFPEIFCLEAEVSNKIHVAGLKGAQLPKKFPLLWNPFLIPCSHGAPLELF